MERQPSTPPEIDFEKLIARFRVTASRIQSNMAVLAAADAKARRRTKHPHGATKNTRQPTPKAKRRASKSARRKNR